MDINEVLEKCDFQGTHGAFDNKKDRLSAIIAVGCSNQYLGKAIQLSDLDLMPHSEIEKLYRSFTEARLGANMTKTLGNTLINLYAITVSRFFPALVNHALNMSCCDLYYKYRIYLAPLTTMLITVKYINFEKKMK